MLEILNADFSEGYREETLNGRSYVVVPTTMITPGVLNGSKGPGFYSAEENKKSVPRWNHVPIVAPDHPVENGKNVSARSPKILNSYQIGVVLNAKDDEGKLKAEAWIDVDNANRIAPRVLWNIYGGLPVEVSTGLGMEANNSAGKFNGEDFAWTAVNYQPDHLAVLTDKIGACSLEDGCGLNVNSKEDNVENSVSAGQLRTLLIDILRVANPGQYIYVSENGVYPAKVVFEKGEDLYEQKYKKKHREISLIGMATKVNRVVSYVAANQRDEPNKPVEKGVPTVDKNALIDSILNSGCGCWTEDDKETLNGFSEEKLKKLEASSKTSVINSKIVKGLEKGVGDEKIRITLNEKKTGIKWEPVVVNDDTNDDDEDSGHPVFKMEDLPEEFQAAINFGKTKMQEEREELTANLLKGVDKEDVDALTEIYANNSIDQLRILSKSKKPQKPVNDYSGRRSPVVNTSGKSEFSSPLVAGSADLS